jgi:hypothetical protein
MKQNGNGVASSRDPLKDLADALDAAITGVKNRTVDANASGESLLSGGGQFLSRVLYKTSYALCYGVAFPAVLLATSVPANNAIVHGFIDGAHAANNRVVAIKKPRLEPAIEPAPSREPAPPRARPRKTTRKKRQEPGA